MTDEKAPQGGDEPKSPAVHDDRPGKQYSAENYQPPATAIDSKVRQLPAFKRAKEKYGPAAHEIKWGPDTFWSYTDQNNPFFYRMPKGMQETPAHVPQNPINLELHQRDERQRLASMTDAEREWRRKYVKAQELHADEPFFINDAINHLNPLRRLYRWPLDTFARKFLYPTLGIARGQYLRQRYPKYVLTILAAQVFYYTLKYNDEVWYERDRCKLIPQMPILAKRDEIVGEHPGLLEKAYFFPKSPEDYYDLGFSDRKIFLNLGETKRPW